MARPRRGVRGGGQAPILLDEVEIEQRNEETLPPLPRIGGEANEGGAGPQGGARPQVVQGPTVDNSSQFFTLVLHHGGFMVNSPRLKYTETEEEDDEADDDVEEDEDYVVDEVEETDSDSGFENSDNDMPDEVCVEEVDYETLMMEMEFGKEKKENEPHLNDNDSESDSLNSLSGNESDEDDRKKPPKCPEFNAEVDMASPQFKKGMKFSGKEILKEAIREYGIKSRHEVRFKRIDKGRLHVICKENSPWYIWALRVDPKDPTNHTWQIKSYVAEHNCVRDFKNRNVTYKWLAKTYFEQWKADPTFSIRSLQQDVQETYSYQVSLSKCLRAKNCAPEIVIGNHKAQYSKIYDYLAEIRTSNPGSTTILHLDNRLFQRMYICLQACKQGFKAACRPIICLDGCHIKNYYGGFLLSAVGVDGNDSLYPICWAVVEAENESSWHWFLSLLMTDLEMTNSYHFTFMSDKQKGLIEVLLELFPHSQHRKCVRHLYSNFKNVAGFKGKNLKDALWKAARSTYKKEFEDAMSELKTISPDAFNWLKEKDHSQWSKSHFRTLCKSDMLLNNFSECFNKLILDARDKPILTMMEMIRNYLMHKMAQKKEVADNYIGTLCPKIQKKLDLAIEHSARCWPTRAGDQMYQVSCGPSNQDAVDLKCFTCTCRKWDLTGIPCSHAVSCMVLENLKPESFVHSCYKIETQQLIYKILPPKLRRPPGRPKTKRKREADEAPQTSTSRFTKRGVKMYCSKCGKSGHNKRTCKGEVGANRPIPKPSKLAGRLPRVPRPHKLQIRMPTETRPSTSTNQPASN
ncbi:hypothetical protein GQ457_11G025620 [Hibiscus cannabinus]